MTTEQKRIKRGRGRPKSKLSPADLDVLREGGTVTELAKRIGIDRRTLRKQIKENKTVSDAFETGREYQLEKVEQTLIDQATDKSNPRSVAASQLLFRLRGKLDGDNKADVSVSIALPQPVSGAEFQRAMKDVTPARAPVTLEHTPPNDQSVPKTFSEILGSRK